jgi:hypothetical protein
MASLLPELLAVLRRPVVGDADLFTSEQFFGLPQVNALREQLEEVDDANAILCACEPELPQLHPNRAALLALLGGAMVENGADPCILFSAAQSLLGTWLCAIAPYCAIETDDDSTPQGELAWLQAQQRLGALDEAQAREVRALGKAIDTLVLPLMAMLMRDRGNHRYFIADAELLALVRQMEDNDSLPFGNLMYLRTASELTYESELIVLLPTSGTGFVADANGVNSTFHAFTLLQRLIGQHAGQLRVRQSMVPRSGDEDSDTAEFHWLRANAFANAKLVDNMALAWGEAPLRCNVNKDGKCVLIALETRDRMSRSWSGFNWVCHPAQNPQISLVRFLDSAEVASYLA